LISREVKALVFPFSLLLFTLVDTPQNPELIKIFTFMRLNVLVLAGTFIFGPQSVLLGFSARLVG